MIPASYFTGYKFESLGAAAEDFSILHAVRLGYVTYKEKKNSLSSFKEKLVANKITFYAYGEKVWIEHQSLVGRLFYTGDIVLNDGKIEITDKGEQSYNDFLPTYYKILSKKVL